MTTEASVQYQDPIRQYLRLYIKDDEDLLEHVLITCFSSFTSNPLLHCASGRGFRQAPHTGQNLCPWASTSAVT